MTTRLPTTKSSPSRRCTERCRGVFTTGWAKTEAREVVGIFSRLLSGIDRRT